MIRNSLKNRPFPVPEELRYSLGLGIRNIRPRSKCSAAAFIAPMSVTAGSRDLDKISHCFNGQ